MVWSRRGTQAKEGRNQSQETEGERSGRDGARTHATRAGRAARAHAPPGAAGGSGGASCRQTGLGLPEEAELFFTHMDRFQ